MPVQLESFAVPPDESGGRHHHERSLPVKEARPERKQQAGWVAESARADLMFPIVGKLLSEEQDFGGQSRTRAGNGLHEPKAVSEQFRQSRETEDHAKEIDGRRTCGFRFAQTADVGTIFSSLKLKKGNI